MREYEVLVNGIPHTFQYSDAEAKIRGLKPADEAVTEKVAAQPANKARTPHNKGA